MLQQQASKRRARTHWRSPACPLPLSPHHGSVGCRSTPLTRSDRCTSCFCWVCGRERSGERLEQKANDTRRGDQPRSRRAPARARRALRTLTSNRRGCEVEGWVGGDHAGVSGEQAGTMGARDTQKQKKRTILTPAAAHRGSPGSRAHAKAHSYFHARYQVARVARCVAKGGGARRVFVHMQKRAKQSECEPKSL